METENQIYKYSCDECEFKTNKKSNWLQHSKTFKHSKNSYDDTLKSIFLCSHCNKEYKSKSGLWSHQKRCEPQLIANTNLVFTQEMLVNLLSKNNELAQLVVDITKTSASSLTTTNHMSNSNNNNNNNNTVNNSFNLNFFLNEQCKDALNIDEFINSIQVTVKDLEITGRLGYAEGISRIILNRLKQLDTYKRPIHCSDLKREIFYVRLANKWDKEKAEKPIMQKAVQDVAIKNIQQLQEWINQYPDCTQYNSSKNSTYLHIITNAMSGSTEEMQEANFNKIVKNIAKETVIDKSNF
jgi:hypothetical protein